MSKKAFFKKLVSLSVSVLFLFSFAVSCGGGGGGGGPAAVKYNDSDQAAASSKAVSGVMALTTSIGNQVTGDLGTASTSFAPKFPRRKAITTDAIANIDPRLKTFVDKMSADLQLSTIKSTLQKTGSFKMKSSASLSSASTYTTGTCNGGGGYTVSETYTVTAYSASITFTNCQSSSTSAPYMIMSGSLQLYMTDNGTSYTNNFGINNLNFKLYSSLTATTPDSTDTMNGTLNMNGTEDSMGNSTGETDTFNGKFTISSTGGDVQTLTFSNISDVWKPLVDAVTGASIDDDVMNGSFTYDISNNGSSIFSVTLGCSGLEDKIRYNNSDLTVDEWLNGGVSLSWTPDLTASNCLPGAITITTAPEDPLHYPSATALDSGTCPDKGTITLNNATIVFVSPTVINVTVGTNTPVTYKSCGEMGGTACSMSM